MNVVEITIRSIEKADIIFKANYPVRSTFGPITPEGDYIMFYVYEGFEIDEKQRPLFSISLGTSSDDFGKFDDGEVFRYEDGKLIER